MAGEKEKSVEEVHHEQAAEEAIAAAEKERKRKPQEPSGGERKKRWRRSIHEMLQLAQEKMDRCGDDDAEEIERRMVVVRHLRRQEAKLDEQDDDAWAAAHPPRRMPEARVAYYRSVLEKPEPRLLDESSFVVGSLFPGGVEEIRKLNEGIREASRSSKEMAAMMMNEFEILDADTFELTPELKKLIFLP